MAFDRALPQALLARCYDLSSHRHCWQTVPLQLLKHACLRTVLLMITYRAIQLRLKEHAAIREKLASNQGYVMAVWEFIEGHALTTGVHRAV